MYHGNLVGNIDTRIVRWEVVIANVRTDRDVVCEPTHVGLNNCVLGVVKIGQIRSLEE